MPEIRVQWVKHKEGDTERAVMLPDPETFSRSAENLKLRIESAESPERAEVLRETLAATEKIQAQTKTWADAARRAGTLIEKVYRFHPYTGDERIKALKEATSWDGMQKRIDDLVFQREIVDQCVENLQDVEGKGVFAGDLDAKLLDRLYGPIAAASEASEDHLFFIARSLPTSGTGSPSSSEPTN